MRKLHTGQILLTAKNTPISNAIEMIDNSDVSHAATVYDENYVVDARGDLPNNCVLKRSLHSLIDESETVYLLTPTNTSFKDKYYVNKMRKFLDKQIGKKYDYFNTIVIQGIRAFGLSRFKLFQRELERASRKWQCAELAAAAGKHTYGYFPSWPKNAISPKLIKESVFYFIEKIK